MYKRYRHFRRVALNWLQAIGAMVRYRFPQKGMILVAVTGTDGKTTTVQLLASILQAADKKVGVISTVGASIAGQQVDLPAHVSTPDTKQLYYLLSVMRQNGVSHVVIETTSHGLDQRRIAGLHFNVGLITNISPEHLDYHGTLEKYLTAKLRLLRLCSQTIVNGEDEHLQKLTGVKFVKTFGWQASQDYWVDSVLESDGKTHFNLHIGDVLLKVKIYLPGRHNVLNSLAAAGAAHTLVIPERAIIDGLGRVAGVPGRWQVVQQKPFYVIVDFGHTPQAFEQILPLARGYVGKNGRLIHVFGCAGGRDVSKREAMGELSGRLADISVLTMEDPRFESLDSIQNQILAGFELNPKKIGQGIERIDDRQKAIGWAIAEAKSGDVVLLTGKGHEKSMNVNGVEIGWDEAGITKKILANA